MGRGRLATRPPRQTSEHSTVDLAFLPEQVEAGTHSMGHLKSSYEPSGKN